MTWTLPGEWRSSGNAFFDDNQRVSQSDYYQGVGWIGDSLGAGRGADDDLVDVHIGRWLNRVGHSVRNRVGVRATVSHGVTDGGIGDGVERRSFDQAAILHG